MTTPGANAPIMQVDQAGSEGAGDGSAVARVVLVLAKAPVPGRAKTRLSPPATPEGAAGMAAAALLDTLDAAAATPHARVVVALEGPLAQAVRADEIGAALAPHTVVAQRGDGLGERIAAAHADVAAAFPGAVSVQVGMDTPQVDADLLDDGAAHGRGRGRRRARARPRRGLVGSRPARPPTGRDHRRRPDIHRRDRSADPRRAADRVRP